MIRVLHFVKHMGRAGLETWLMEVLRRADPGRLSMDFVVQTPEAGEFDAEIRARGSRIHVCPVKPRPWEFPRRLARILSEGSPYDVVHSHVHHFSGCVLAVAARAGVPVRIAHSHSDTAAKERRAGPLRAGYLALTERLIAHYATHGLGCSAPAAADLFGAGWREDPRRQVLYCGIDLAPFAQTVDRGVVRRALGLPEEAFVVGHVGRFVESKNHAHLVAMMAEVARGKPGARLLLVGDGPLRPAVLDQARRQGLEGRVVWTGPRTDVPTLMLGAMDAFVFPSLYEGLGLALIEAQAAGLPCVIAGGIPEDVDVCPELIERLPLEAPALRWAAAALRCRGRDERSRAWAAVAASPFNIVRSVESLTSLYEGACRREH